MAAPARVRPSYEAARRQRAELLQAIQGLEQGVAAPAREPGWRERVAQQLARLRDRLTDHIVITEGPDGLYAALLADAPRLNRPVAGLTADHDRLLVRVDALARRLRQPDYPVEAVRGGAGELLSQLSRHRQRGADLVYEAYATDIGGET
jgi:hemerythrin HHE cation binding domain-containing protein